ncbi:hypothetical protein NDU88_003263 [Pleurodeles waltl]|uniref:Uncharacterized protein n=1 Tax=Pleurodeles waltl TaxID=8319 RepID=A0AAV7W1M6_PLEWA|nr:hypothetical protein NDU88_003263 [Pleurodeles waltl]
MEQSANLAIFRDHSESGACLQSDGNSRACRGDKLSRHTQQSEPSTPHLIRAPWCLRRAASRGSGCTSRPLPRAASPLLVTCRNRLRRSDPACCHRHFRLFSGASRDETPVPPTGLTAETTAGGPEAL